MHSIAKYVVHRAHCAVIAILRVREPTASSHKIHSGCISQLKKDACECSKIHRKRIRGGGIIHAFTLECQRAESHGDALHSLNLLPNARFLSRGCMARAVGRAYHTRVFCEANWNMQIADDGDRHQVFFPHPFKNFKRLIFLAFYSVGRLTTQPHSLLFLFTHAK